MTLSVRFFSPSDDAIPLPPDLAFVVLRYSAADPGGPVDAEVALNGPDEAVQDCAGWLGYLCEIRNEHGTRTWVGMLEEHTYRYGVFEVGLTLSGLANRVMVEYTTEGAGGVITTHQTGWLDDTDSIARYGTREFVERRANLSAEAALAWRASVLAERSKPQKVLRLAGRQYGGLLRCRGLWASYDWVRYVNPAGLASYDAGASILHPLGLGFTASSVGFAQTAEGSFLHTVGGQALTIVDGYRIRVSGSASNDGSYTVAGGTSDEPESYTADTISFEAGDNVFDPSGGLGELLSAGDLAQISGAADSANNRYAFIDGVLNSEETGTEVDIFTAGVDVVTAAAGPDITVVRANAIAVDASFTLESPGASVTVLTHGAMMAASFQIASVEAWTAAAVVLMLGKRGAPGDNLQVELCADSGGAPGSVLDTGTLAGSVISEQAGWLKVPLSNTDTLNPGTTYWLVISRTGANDWDDHYWVGVSEELGYPDGQLLVWDGLGWVDRAPDADLLFQVLGATQTTQQIEEMAESAGWLIAGVNVQGNSGVTTNQYRDGQRTALADMARLLQAGTSNAKPLQALISPDRVLHVSERPDAVPADDWVYTADGRLRLPGGREVERGVLPAGRWLTLKGSPGSSDALAQLSPFYCRGAEYDAVGDVMTPDVGLQSIWEIGGLEE